MDHCVNIWFKVDEANCSYVPCISRGWLMIDILLAMLEFEHKLQDIVYGPGTLWFCFYIYRASSFYRMISNIYLSILQKRKRNTLTALERVYLAKYQPELKRQMNTIHSGNVLDEKDSIEKVFKSCTWERCHSCLKSSLTLLKYCWLQSENSWVTHTSWQTRCDKLFLQKEKLTFDSRVKRDTFAVKDDYVSYPSRVHFFDL